MKQRVPNPLSLWSRSDSAGTPFATPGTGATLVKPLPTPVLESATPPVGRPRVRDGAGLGPSLNPVAKPFIVVTGHSTGTGHASIEAAGCLHTTNMQDAIDVIAPDP